jgi:hypothetical protein
VLAFELPLLRDGYTLRPELGGTFQLTVCGLGGIRGASVSQDEIDRRDLPAIVAEWKADMDRSAISVRFSTDAGR